MTTPFEQRSGNPATEDVQQLIAASADSVPDEVWQALEATRPFLESQQRLPRFVTSMIGTGGVF